MQKSFFLILQTILVLLCAGSAGAWAQADSVEVENKAYWLCKNHKEVRTIRIQISTQGVCSTFYSKQGAEKVVGSGKNHDSCFNFLNSIKGNLEKANWNCRDISATRITASTSAD